MSTGYIRSALCWTVLALLLASCVSEEGAPQQTTETGESAAFTFDIAGYAPRSRPSGLATASAAVSQPSAVNVVTLTGAVLAVPVSATGVELASSARQFVCSVLVNEGQANVLGQCIPSNLPAGEYRFYALLTNGETTYGGIAPAAPGAVWTIIKGADNAVQFTLFPVLASIGTDVWAFRSLSSQPLILTYDPARLGGTRPKLVITLGDGTLLTYVVNPDPADPRILLFLDTVGGTPAHQFYYGTVVIGAPTDGTATNDPTPLLTYTIDDPCFATNSCGETVLVDGVDTTARNGDELGSLNDGHHFVRVIFEDGLGGMQFIELSFDVDATPPTIIVQDPGTGGVIQDGGTLGSNTGSLNVGSDETSTVTLYLDPDAVCVTALQGSGDLTLCAAFQIDSLAVDINQTVSSTVSGLLPGVHHLYILAVDGLGNEAVQIVTFTVVDVTAPHVQIVDPAVGLHPSRTVPLSYSASDDVTPAASLTVDVQVDLYDPIADSWAPAAGTTMGAGSLSVASDGRFRVTVSATDAAGLTGSAVREFSVDTTDPVVEIVEPATGGTVFTGRPQLVVNATEDNLFQTQIFLFAGPLRLYGAEDLLDIHIDGLLQNQDGTPLMDGQYTVVVELTDAVNRTGMDFSTFTVNSVAPFVDIINPLDGDTVTNGSLNLKYNAHDASHVEVWLRSALDPNPAQPLLVRAIDPVEPVPRTYQETIAVPVDGGYTVTVVAKDVNLPAVQSEDSVSFSVDSRKPGVSIILPADETAYAQPGNPVELRFQVSDATGYRVLVDGAVVEEGALDGTPAELSTALGPFEHDGAHRVAVEVSDGQSGNSDGLTLVIDGTAPRVHIRSPDDNRAYDDDDVTLVYSVHEANGIKRQMVWLNGMPQDDPHSRMRFRDLPAGTNLLEVQVEDLAGNFSERVGVSFRVVFKEHHGDHRKGRTSCIRTPIAGSSEALHALLQCVRNPKSHHDH